MAKKTQTRPGKPAKQSPKGNPVSAPTAPSLPDPTVETPVATTTQDVAPSPTTTAAPTTPGKRVVVRASIFGFPVTGVLRWMGKEGWTFDEARKAINAHGASGISDTTVRIQLPAGKRGQRGEPAALSEDQIAELEAAKN